MTNKEIFPHPLSVHNYLLRIRGGAPLYLESGLFDLLEVAPLNENTYKRAQLYFSDPPDSDPLSTYSETDEALMGKISVSRNSVDYDPELNEGPSESGVGCKEDDLQKRVTGQSSGGDTETYYSPTPIFCDQDVQQRKYAQYIMPASVFSGKMREYVQCIYGSRREDYLYVEGIGSEISGLLWIESTYHNPYFSASTKFIYTVPSGTDDRVDYQHFMLNISEDGVEVAKMELSDKGEKLRKWLVANPQDTTETRRVEGYLLSETTLSDSWFIVGDSDDVGASYDKGTPLAYGWHFNMAGTEGQKVTHVYDEDEGFYTSTHWKVTVSLSFDNFNPVDYWKDSLNWSFTVEEVEETQNYSLRFLKDLVWIPDLVLPGMDCWITGDGGQTQIDSDVPIYVTYDYANDEFSVIRYEQTDTGSGGGSLGGGYTRAADVGTIHTSGGSACDYYSNSSGSKEAGFYVDGVADADAVVRDASSVDMNGIELDRGEFIRCEPSLGTGAMFECKGGSSVISNADITAKSMLVLPKQDCESIFLGAWEHFEGDVTWRNGMYTWTEHPSGKCSGGELSSTGEFGWDDPVDPQDPNRSFVEDLVQSGTSETGSVTNAEWDKFSIYHFHNGEEVQVYSQERASDDDDSEHGMYFPACLNTSPFFELETQGDGLHQEAFNQNGWSGHFDPIFLEGDVINEQSIYTKSNLTDNYRATKHPTQPNDEDGWVSDDGYDYETLSPDANERHISFVGHD